VVAFTARSQPARDAVLAAARRGFAAHGVERATVRAIAADAGVDPSMVIRYFGSKDGLFSAATDVDLALPDLVQVPAADRGSTLARRFVELWDDPTTGEVLTLLLRAAPTSDRARDRVRDVFATQVLGMVRRLDGTDDAAEDSSEAAGSRARAGVLGSVIMGTALSRYVLALPPIADASGDEVVASLAPVLQRVLGGSAS
jgi:AcrR family transcriptional regulator